MDKQIGKANKMVEEIEQFLARKILGGKAWNTRDIAEGVYELITENAVVLTQEELEHIQSNSFDVGIKHGSKETAEKFAERLKEKGTIHTEFDWNDYLQIDIDDIDEIRKEITEGKV